MLLVVLIILILWNLLAIISLLQTGMSAIHLIAEFHRDTSDHTKQGKKVAHHYSIQQVNYYTKIICFCSIILLHAGPVIQANWEEDVNCVL